MAPVAAPSLIPDGSPYSHRPTSFEFFRGGFIHYGQGNLFFEQIHSLNTRQESIDRHSFCDGRHIRAELLTAILENCAQPRPMTLEERAPFPSAVFRASGW